MQWQGYDGVEVDPEKLSGTPVLKGTRVPVDLVLECLDAGDPVDEIAYNYDLKPADILRLRLFRESYHGPALRP